MYSLKKSGLYILIIFTFIFSTSDLWAWKEKPLLVINQQSYSVDDFKSWWMNWKENNASFPNDLREFIEWHLLVEEAKQMELDSIPSYRKKLETFLRVRGIFLLKNEEIDSKITINDDEILYHFNSRYNPVWKIRILTFDTEQSSIDYYNKIKIKTSDQSSAQIIFDEQKISSANRILSPISFKDDDMVFALLKNMKEGEISEPFLYADKFTIIELTNIETRNDDFFQSHKERVTNDLRKKKQSQLTNILLNKLKNKFNVTVNQDLFKIAHNENLSLNDLDKILVNTSNGGIQLSSFVNNVRKDTRIRKKDSLSDNDIEKIKESILNGMLFDILIAWEILDRHYENFPPLKHTYEFYKQNRLIVELNKEVFEKKILIDDSEVRNYYNANLQEFSKPEIYSLSILRVENDLEEKVWSDIKRGGDFFEIIKKYQQSDLPVQQMIITDLEPELRGVVKQLSVGEVSAPIVVKTNSVFIKLIAKKASDVTPLDQVTAEIGEKIYKQTLARLKNEYVTRLKAKSSISINEDRWRSLRQEFGDSNGSQDN